MEHTTSLEELESIVKNNIKIARLNARMQQKEVAKALGVPNNYICLVEQGKRKLTAAVCFKMCELYNVKQEDMFDPSYAVKNPKPNMIRMTKTKQRSTALEERVRK